MSNCELCGEPMPTGEEMFKYHGLTGPCPVKPTEYDLLAIAKSCVCEPLSRPSEEIERIGQFALNMRSENDRLRAEVDRLRVINDDMVNAALDAWFAGDCSRPHYDDHIDNMRQALTAALDAKGAQAEQEEGK